MPVIRKEAKAVVVDGDKTAIMSFNHGRHYNIPGGGIDFGETEIQAAMREASEESGCQVELVSRVGEDSFVSAKDQVEHHSVCYLARVVGERGTPKFDEWERSQRAKVIWVTFDEAFKLFENPKTETKHHLEIHNRDYEYLKKAKEILDNLN